MSSVHNDSFIFWDLIKSNALFSSAFIIRAGWVLM